MTLVLVFMVVMKVVMAEERAVVGAVNTGVHIYRGDEGVDYPV